MLRNYLKIAWRNLLRHKLTSVINLSGLALGLACCLLIGLYIRNERSYDTQHPHAGNTYRIERTFLNPATKDISLKLSAVAPPFKELLKNDFPEIQHVTSLVSNGQTPFRFGEKIFNETNVYFADEQLGSVFDVQLTRGGSAAVALREPYSVLLSEPVARKYFGDADPVNQLVQLGNNLPCKVTGVYRPFAPNTHIHPSVLVSFSTLRDSVIYGAEQLRTNFGNNAFFTYLVLPEHYDYKRLEGQLPAFQNRHIPPDNNGTIKASEYSLLTLRPLTDIHLNAHNDDEAEPNGDIKRVYIFSVIALFILLIACINYMNLSTARSLLRAREIGVRKVIGAQRRELVWQFLIESLLLTFLATLVAVGAVLLLLPSVNSLAGTELSADTLLQPAFLLTLLLVPVVVGLLAGIYPAIFLSSFRPIAVLKGLMKIGGGTVSLRRTLVVVQFAISIVLIIATAVVFQQLSYLRNKSLGYDRAQVVNLFYNTTLAAQFESFRQELRANRNIKEVARSSRIPTGRLLDNMGSMMRRGDSLAPTQVDIKYVVADPGFLPLFGVPMAAGRNFYPQGGDSSNFLLNEAAVHALGLKSADDAIGMPFQYGRVQGAVVGVYKDFHFESLHQRIVPLLLVAGSANQGYNVVSVKLSGNIEDGLRHLEQAWKRFSPDAPFDYNFLDGRYDQLYDSEQRQGKLFTAFAFIALFIACLGLLGLSLFAISQRVREIGIRKVLGADVRSIVLLLSRDFLKPVLIGTLVAFPLAWIAMKRWLEDFAYRIDMPWWVFLFAGIVAALVAFGTVSVQALRAASVNPSRNLRTE